MPSVYTRDRIDNLLRLSGVDDWSQDFINFWPHLRQSPGANWECKDLGLSRNECLKQHTEVLALKLCELLSTYLNSDLKQSHLVNVYRLDSLVAHFLSRHTREMKDMVEELSRLDFSEIENSISTFIRLIKTLSQLVNGDSKTLVLPLPNRLETKIDFKLENFFAKIEDSVEIAILVGSHGSSDAIPGVSDLDILAFSKPCVLTDPTKLANLRWKLNELNSIINEVDSNQHHGLLMVPHESLQMYPKEYFPLTVTQYGKNLTPQKNEIIIKESESAILPRMRIEEVVQFFRNHLSWFPQRKEAFSVYEWKYILANYLIFPCLFFQLSNLYLFKKHAIANYKKLVSIESPIYVVEEIRLAGYQHEMFTSLESQFEIIYLITLELNELHRRFILGSKC